jgi:hypothetical protein
VPVIAVLNKPHGLRIGRRGALAIAGIGAAAALSVATISNPWLGHAVQQGLSDGLHGVETVAAMLADRSPGARPEGALANLKHKRQAALHERALPKIRAPYGPPTAYEALATPPIAPIAPLPQAPPFATIAGGPPVVPPGNGGGEGGPPVLSTIPGPGGGGGGTFTPPVVLATPQAPPVAVPVPEPASWAMMLLGFALMGRALRRRGAAGLQPARH